MIDFTEFCESMGNSFGIDDPSFSMDLSIFMVSNKWFGIDLVQEDDHIMIQEDDKDRIKYKIAKFCENYNKTEEDKAFYLLEQMQDFIPQTTSLFVKYIKTANLEPEVANRLADFLITFLPGELHQSTDTEVDELVEDAFTELSKAYADMLTDFINWVKSKLKGEAHYNKTYFMGNYSENKDKTNAYDPYNYFKILYHLYNETYIDDNDMYAKAAESKNYVDTWLYLALHFLCALRNTDLLRIPHPRLNNAPEEVLRSIEVGTFSDDEARSVLGSIIFTLTAMQLTPNKTKGVQGVGTIKFSVPTSVEVHIGTLFAAAEAHYQLENGSPEEPLIRVITRYEDIDRYMGEEIGDLFLESNFSSRAANKSYMQMVYLLTDDVLGATDEFKVKGYMFAAMARSHKGDYGSFASTTSIYLKDAKMSGVTPEFVAKELFERGVLSMIPTMLLQMVMGKEFDDLTVENQTKLVQELNLSPNEVENSVSLAQQTMRKSTAIVTNLYSHHTKEEILEILHKMGNGEAYSKEDECMCLMTAMNKSCPNVGRKNCIGCEYEITSKSTMFLLVREFARLKYNYKNATNPLEKERYKAITTDVLKPCFTELLLAVEQSYGEEALRSLENIMEGAL